MTGNNRDGRSRGRTERPSTGHISETSGKQSSDRVTTTIHARHDAMSADPTSISGASVRGEAMKTYCESLAGTHTVSDTSPPTQRTERAGRGRRRTSLPTRAITPSSARCCAFATLRRSAHVGRGTEKDVRQVTAEVSPSRAPRAHALGAHDHSSEFTNRSKAQAMIPDERPNAARLRDGRGRAA